MPYPIEPVFVVFPLACLILSLMGVGNNRTTKVLITLAFLLIYSFSLNGSDLDGYGILFRGVTEGESASQLHGELGYYWLMKLFIFLGIGYIPFRIILLSICSIVLFAGFSKLSDNFALSAFYLSSLFVIYTISAYRQFIVIAFSIWWIYQYDRKRRIRAVVGLAGLLFFHITAILPLFAVLYHYISGMRKTKRQQNFFQYHYILLISAALLIRVAITVVLNQEAVNRLIASILAGHASPRPTLFSFGLASRVALLLCVSYIFRHTSQISTGTRILYWYYFISMILYIMIPLELTMGRLMNNANILLAILIPALRYHREPGQRKTWGISLDGKTCAMVFSWFVALFVLINQLSHQDGYTPYLNVLRGDEPVVFTVEENTDWQTEEATDELPTESV